MTWLLLGLLCLMIYLGALAAGKGDLNDQWSRVAWIGIGCGLILATQAPNPFAATLIALCSLNLLWNQPMSITYRDRVAESLVLTAAYILCAPRMQSWMVPWLLGMMAAVGSWLGVQAWYGFLKRPKDVEFRDVYLRGWLHFHDRTAGAPLAGQGNYNHAQSVGALSTASVLGLWFLGYYAVLPLLFLTLSATILCCEGGTTGRWVSQGWVHLGWVGIALLLIWLNTSGAIIVSSSVCLALLLWAHPWNPRPEKWYDSHRFETWNHAIRELWWTGNQPQQPTQALQNLAAQMQEYQQIQAQAAVEGNALVHNQMTIAMQTNEAQAREIRVLEKMEQGQPLTAEDRTIQWAFWAHRWRVRLIGFGTGMWYPMTKWPALLKHGTLDVEKRTITGTVYLSAHNEFVELWFEQGIVGLLAALGFAVYGLSETWSGGAVGHAVLIPLMALLSIACCNFPFTLFRTVEKSHPAQPDQFVGAPAMLVMSLMVLLMVEAVR